MSEIFDALLLGIAGSALTIAIVLLVLSIAELLGLWEWP